LYPRGSGAEVLRPSPPSSRAPAVYLLSGYKVEHDTSLQFEKAGSIEIQFQVAPIGAKEQKRADICTCSIKR
jgi:hypothetical protein